MIISFEMPETEEKKELRAILRTKLGSERFFINNSDFSTSPKDILKEVKTTHPDLASVKLVQMQSPQVIGT